MTVTEEGTVRRGRCTRTGIHTDDPVLSAPRAGLLTDARSCRHRLFICSF